MSSDAQTTVFWCRLPIVAAALCFCAACGTGFNISSLFLSTKHLTATAFVAGGSLFAALGIREFAGLLFNMEDKPWYGRASGALFLGAMLTMTIFVTLQVTRSWLDHDVLRTVPFHPLPYLIAGFTLLWVVLFDWPTKASRDRCTKPQRTAMTTRPRSSCPGTRPFPSSSRGTNRSSANAATKRQAKPRAKGVLSKNGRGSTNARISK